MSIHRARRRCSYILASSVAALSISVAPSPPVQAASLFELLLRGVQIIQLSNVSGKQEIQIGKQIDRQMQRQMQFYRDSNINDYVKRVGQRLAAGKKRTDIPYKFQVVRSSSVNAFATTGGYVYVTTGLLEAADNEAQLASVIGHEMGHIESRHLIEQMRQTAITRGLASAAGIDQNVAANIGLELALNRPRSRQDEFEADQVGLRLMRAAGYAESASPEFMKKLLRRGSSVPTFLSTHPAVPDRIEALEKLVQSSSGNSCKQNPQASSCGLNEYAYKQSVRNRL